MEKTYTLSLTKELITYNRVSKEPNLQSGVYFFTREVLVKSIILKMQELDNQDYSDSESTKD
jgi:hypothetical protein